MWHSLNALGHIIDCYFVLTQNWFFIHPIYQSISFILTLVYVSIKMRILLNVQSNHS